MEPERKDTQLAIVVPCYNEGEMLGISVPRLVSLVDDLVAHHDCSPHSYIVLVDDGSRDDTWKLIASAAERNAGMLTLNLGTGRGHSVLEMVNTFERACGGKIPYAIVPRRSGDIAACWADSMRAQTLLGWRASRDIDAMCADTWRWQSSNPEGYN